MLRLTLPTPCTAYRAATEAPMAAIAAKVNAHLTSSQRDAVRSVAIKGFNMAGAQALMLVNLRRIAMADLHGPEKTRLRGTAHSGA